MTAPTRSPSVDDSPEPLSGRSVGAYRDVFDSIIAATAEGRMTLAVLKEVALTLFRFFECEVVEFVYQEKQKLFHAKCTPAVPPACSGWKEKTTPAGSCLDVIESVPRPLIKRLASLRPPDKPAAVGRQVVFMFPDGRQRKSAPERPEAVRHLFLLIPGGRSLRGCLALTFPAPRRADAVSRTILDRLTALIGLSLSHNRSRFELRERVKELTCMYSIANLAMDSSQPIEVFLQRVAELLPSAYLHPDITEARATVDGRSYHTAGFVPAACRQSAAIIVGGLHRGEVEVIYREPRPELDEGPFLAEERRLLDSVARETALIIERKEAESEKVRLQAQLQHADRLATIGKLAAGVAHELNEPLTGILGFAELLAEIPGMPAQAASDLARIEAAALHAREVVRKLLLFARQISPRQDPVEVNQLAAEVASFFGARCTQQGIDVRLALEENLPAIPADEAQIRQILVNLVVNAIHAMEGGGRLTVSTRQRGTEILLTVRDTGTGIPEEVKEKIFLPFFSTKEIDQGTGLGLSVVHGIVKSHRGRIKVSSTPGKGSEFRVYLPSGGPR